jgi:hypothetical protein
MPLIHQAQSKADTVIINFGSSSKIIFHINDKEDLNALQSYDLNALVSDMKSKIEADTTLITEQESDQYLRDSLSLSDEISERESTEDNNKADDNSWRERDEDNSWREREDDWRDKGEKWKEQGKRWTDDGNNIVISNKIGSNHFINFDLGINNYVEDGKSPSSDNAQHTVKPWGSWYFAINSVHKNHIGGALSIETSIGISWYNFKFEDASTRLLKTDTDVQFISGPAGDSFKKSKLTASFANISLVPVLDFGRDNKSFRMGAGVYGGYRLGSHTKYRYKLDGKRERDKDRDNFFLNNWRYGARLQLGYKGTDFFVNYDINELFTTGKGPKLNAFSFGITF